MDILTQYQLEYSKFANIERSNMTERAMQVPAVKHSWVSRLINSKVDRSKLLKKRKSLMLILSQKISDSSPVAVSKSMLTQQLENHEDLEEINEQIKELDLVIEYLEHVVKTVSFIAQDIKNMIELRQMEET